MIKKRLFALAFLAFSAVFPTFSQQKPNIIYILADDLGYADLGCFGSKKIKTPVLDALAAKGLKLTRHYSTAVCAPSRACLMTGKHLGNCEIRGNRQAPQTGYGQMPLSDTAVTVATVLKNAGYATAQIGKWGLGEPGSSGEPSKKGFDLYFGYTDQVLAHNHFPEFLIKNGSKVFLNNKVKYLDSADWHKGRGSYSLMKKDFSQDLFTAEALNFISAKKSNPFFIYFAPIIPHDNGEAPKGEMIESPTTEPYTNEKWTEDEKRYAASITYLDKEIGKIVAHLEKEGLDKNTLLVFVSDNGPKQSDIFESTGGLRGIKRDLYEGGLRVPFVAYWPGTIKAGLVSATPTALWDFMPTACELAKTTCPKTDGISLVPLFSGKNTQKRDYLYFELYDGGNKQALLMGKWKAVRTKIEEGKPLPKLELYNLEIDPNETKDIAASNAAIVNKMEEIMKKEHSYNRVFGF